jgi:hypothetical protein
MALLCFVAEEHVAFLVALADDQGVVCPAVLDVLAIQAGHLRAAHARVEQHMQQLHARDAEALGQGRSGKPSTWVRMSGSRASIFGERTLCLPMIIASPARMAS